MITLAVTGGIGSGKSFVARILSAMGCPVFDTDSEVKRLYSTSSEVRSALRAILGDSVFFADSSLNRAAMAAKVFSDDLLLSQVESAVYPSLAGNLDIWLEEYRKCDTAVAVVESALILEKDTFLSVTDKVMTVSAPEACRLERAMKRDGSTREKVEERMRCQNSDTWREERADFVIINDGRPLLPQLVKIIDKLQYGD